MRLWKRAPVTWALLALLTLDERARAAGASPPSGRCSARSSRRSSAAAWCTPPPRPTAAGARGSPSRSPPSAPAAVRSPRSSPRASPPSRPKPGPPGGSPTSTCCCRRAPSPTMSSTAIARRSTPSACWRRCRSAFVPFHVLLEHAGSGAAFAASWQAFALNTGAAARLRRGRRCCCSASGMVTHGRRAGRRAAAVAAASYAAWKDIFGVRDAPHRRLTGPAEAHAVGARARSRAPARVERPRRRRSPSTRASGGPRRAQAMHRVDRRGIALQPAPRRCRRGGCAPSRRPPRRAPRDHRLAKADALHPARWITQPRADGSSPTARSRRSISNSAATVLTSVISPRSSAASISSTGERARSRGTPRGRAARRRA